MNGSQITSTVDPAGRVASLFEREERSWVDGVVLWHTPTYLGQFRQLKLTAILPYS